MTLVATSLQDRVGLACGPVSLLRPEPRGGGWFVGSTSMDCGVVRQGAWIWRRSLASASSKHQASDRMRSVSFSAGGEVAYVAAGERVWAVRVADGEPVWDYLPPNLHWFLNNAPLAAVAHPRDGVFACLMDGTFVDLGPEGRPRRIWKDERAPYRLEALDGGDVVGAGPHTLGVWNPEGRRRMKLTLPDRAFALAVRQGGRLAAVRLPEEVIVFDLDAGGEIARLAVHDGAPVLALSPDRPRLAMVLQGALVEVDFGGAVLSCADVGPDWVTSAAYSPDGAWIGVGLGSGSLARVRSVG